MVPRTIPLMTSSEWTEPSVTRYFSIRENWGDPYRVAQSLISGLVILREKAKHPVHIHCAFATDGHAPRSMHYRGLAADLHIEGTSLADMVAFAGRSLFAGIGCYPNWHTPGIHVDCRDLADRYPAYWIEPVKGSGEYVYYPSLEALLDALAAIERKVM